MQTNLAIRPRVGQVYVCRDGLGFEPAFFTPADLGRSVAGFTEFKDSTFRVVNVTDSTKRIAFSTASMATNVTQTISMGAQAASRTVTIPTGGTADFVMTATLNPQTVICANSFTFQAQSGTLVCAGADTSSGSTTQAISVNYGNISNTSAGVEMALAYFNGAALSWQTGAIANQRSTQFLSSVLSFVAASVVTNSATVSIGGAPTAGANATIINRWALMVEADGIAVAGRSVFGATTADDGVGVAQFNGAASFLSVAAPGSPTLGNAWNDSTRKSLVAFLGNSTANAIKTTLSGCIFSSTADAGPTNTVTETSVIGSGIGSKVLPADWWAIGKSIKITVTGRITNTLTPTIQVKGKINSTIVVDTTAVATAAITGTRFWKAEIYLTCRTLGATGSIQGQGCFEYSTTTSTIFRFQAGNTIATTIDTTIANTLDVTLTWGTASASNAATGTNCTVEVLN